MSSTLRKVREQGKSSSSDKLKVTLLSHEWWSRHDGISTLNRVLAKQLAKHPLVDITVFLLECSEKEKREALSHNIKIVKAEKRPGLEESMWLCFPPDHLQIDIVIGHGAVLGGQANTIKETRKQCRWIQVVHTVPEELAMFNNDQDRVSKGQKKQQIENELCEMADIIVGVGPKLSEASRSHLRWCKHADDVINLTPGIFSEYSDVQQAPQDGEKCRVLAFGCGDEEDFELKGFDIAAKAVAELDNTMLIFVGAREEDLEQVRSKFLKCGLSPKKIVIRGFLPDKQRLRQLLCEVDLALMPSRTEGFGLTALEALSAGLPVLVSHNSGFGEALSKIAFGQSCVIDSEEPSVWAMSIKGVWEKNRKLRLDETDCLRTLYGNQYSWENQCEALVNKMMQLTRAEQEQPEIRMEKKLSNSRTTHRDSEQEQENELNDGKHQTLDDYTCVRNTREHQMKDGGANVKEQQKAFCEEQRTRTSMKEEFSHAIILHEAQIERLRSDRLPSQTSQHDPQTREKTQERKPKNLKRSNRKITFEENLRSSRPEAVKDSTRWVHTDREKQPVLSTTQELLAPNVERENYVNNSKEVDELSDEQQITTKEGEKLGHTRTACSEAERRLKDEGLRNCQKEEKKHRSDTDVDPDADSDSDSDADSDFVLRMSSKASRKDPQMKGKTQETKLKTLGKGNGRNTLEENVRSSRPETVEDSTRGAITDQSKQTAMSAAQDILTPNVECENYVNNSKEVNELSDEQQITTKEGEKLGHTRTACSEAERRLKDEGLRNCQKEDTEELSDADTEVRSERMSSDTSQQDPKMKKKTQETKLKTLERSNRRITLEENLRASRPETVENSTTGARADQEKQSAFLKQTLKKCQKEEKEHGSDTDTDAGTDTEVRSKLMSCEISQQDPQMKEKTQERNLKMLEKGNRRITLEENLTTSLPEKVEDSTTCASTEQEKHTAMSAAQEVLTPNVECEDYVCNLKEVPDELSQERSFFDCVRKEVECSVCQEQFNRIKEPRTLDCLHTFCKSCLEGWLREQGGRALSCPTCRQITECPNNNIDSLPVNLSCKKMVDIVNGYSGLGQEDLPHCGSCGRERRSLKFYCCDCKYLLCVHCTKAHTKISGHRVKEIGSFELSDEQDYVRRGDICKEHKEQVRFYCEQCVACICLECYVLEHREHGNIVSLDEGLKKTKTEIETEMRAVQANGSRLRNQKELLERRRLRMNNSIAQATKEMHNAAEPNIQLICQNEASATEQLNKQKQTFDAKFSNIMTRLDETLMEMERSLNFGNDLLERSNLPEILNGLEELKRRFQQLQHLEPVSVSEPSLSVARGTGLAEGTQGEYCTFKVITKDSQGRKTYSEIDEVKVDIHSQQTGTTLTANVTDSRDGCYKVSYKPEAAGEFNVSITVAGEAISGSPFQLKVMERKPMAKERKKGKYRQMTDQRKLYQCEHTTSKDNKGFPSVSQSVKVKERMPKATAGRNEGKRTRLPAIRDQGNCAMAVKGCSVQLHEVEEGRLKATAEKKGGRRTRLPVIKDKRNCGMTESKGNEGCPVQTEEKERMPIANAERKEEKRSRFPDIS